MKLYNAFFQAGYALSVKWVLPSLSSEQGSLTQTSKNYKYIAQRLKLIQKHISLHVCQKNVCACFPKSFFLPWFISLLPILYLLCCHCAALALFDVHESVVTKSYHSFKWCWLVTTAQRNVSQNSKSKDKTLCLAIIFWSNAYNSVYVLQLRRKCSWMDYVLVFVHLSHFDCDKCRQLRNTLVWFDIDFLTQSSKH